MAEYLSPGVYVEEFDSGGVPMQGVSTSTAGFVGFAEKGPTIGAPLLVTSFADFKRKYGAYLPEKEFGEYRFLAYAVEHFFINGGARAYIMRAVATGSEPASAETTGRLKKINAKNPGTWANGMTVAVKPSSKAKTTVTEDFKTDNKIIAVRLKSADGFAAGDVLHFVDKTANAAKECYNTVTVVNKDVVELLTPMDESFLDIQSPPTKTVSTCEFNMDIVCGDSAESYENLSFNEAVPGYILKRLEKSELITVTLDAAPTEKLRALNEAKANSDKMAKAAMAAEEAAKAAKTLAEEKDKEATIATGDEKTAKEKEAKEAGEAAKKAEVKAEKAEAEAKEAKAALAEAEANVVETSGAMASAKAAADKAEAALTAAEAAKAKAEAAKTFAEEKAAEAAEATGSDKVAKDKAATDAAEAAKTAMKGAGAAETAAQEVVAAAKAAANEAVIVTPFEEISRRLDKSADADPDKDAEIEAFTVSLSGGKVGTPGDENVAAGVLMGTDNGPGKRTGIKAFLDNTNVSLMAVPGVTTPTVLLDLVSHCENTASRFAVLDMPKGTSNTTELKTFRDYFDTQYAALYHPWLQVFDALDNKNIYMPPSGSVLGIYARSDTARGVHKAPANEVVRNCVGLDVNFGKGEQDVLNPVGINLIRSFPGLGIRVWGARTASSNGLWKYVNVRRLFIYVEESIRANTNWVVFEPNDTPLWARVKRTIEVFLTTTWRSGALQGASAAEAFYVNCGMDTMTQDDIDNGRLICEIGIAPVKPAEFVIFRITQKTAT